MQTTELRSLEKSGRPVRDAALKPSVVSFSRSFRAKSDALTAGDVAARLADVLLEVARTVRQAGGFIGHIKAYLSLPSGGALGLSVVRDRVDRKEAGFQPRGAVSDFSVSVTAIVYGCAEDELSRLLNLGLALGLPRSLGELSGDGRKVFKPIMPLMTKTHNASKSL